MKLTIVTTVTLVLGGIAGCISPDTSIPPSDTSPNSSKQEESRQEVPGGVILQYTGYLESDACMVTNHANTCQPHARAASNPPPQVSWHEIQVESAIELSIEGDWIWQEPGHATFYVRLICQDRNHKPCMKSDGNVAYRSDEAPVINIPALDFQAFDPGHHRLWAYFGVEPQTNAAGDHYPRVNVEYTLTVQFKDAE